MRLGIYVGSFSPPHKGHQQLMVKILKQDLVDKLLVIATGNYWHKQNLLPLALRIKMLQVYEDERIVVDTKHNDIPYTYELFNILCEEYPDVELSLVMGADNLLHFKEWVNYQDLLKYPFIVVERNGVDIDKEMSILNKDNYCKIAEVMNISSSYINEHLDSDLSKYLDSEIIDLLKGIKKISTRPI